MWPVTPLAAGHMWNPPMSPVRSPRGTDGSVSGCAAGLTVCLLEGEESERHRIRQARAGGRSEVPGLREGLTDIGGDAS